MYSLPALRVCNTLIWAVDLTRSICLLILVSTRGSYVNFATKAVRKLSPIFSET